MFGMITAVQRLPIPLSFALVSQSMEDDILLLHKDKELRDSSAIENLSPTVPREPLSPEDYGYKRGSK